MMTEEEKIEKLRETFMAAGKPGTFNWSNGSDDDIRTYINACDDWSVLEETDNAGRMLGDYCYENKIEFDGSDEIYAMSREAEEEQDS